MKTAIVYASVHHGNTKKIVDEIAKNEEVDLIDATQIKEKNLSEYDLIGFASGIYFGKFHQSVLDLASVNEIEDKKVFLICTYGGSEAYKSIEPIIESKGAEIVGKFSCKGYDTFGPFKLIGGVAKGHPNDMDLVAAVDFFENLLKNTKLSLIILLIELINTGFIFHFTNLLASSSLLFVCVVLITNFILYLKYKNIPISCTYTKYRKIYIIFS